MKKSQQVLFTSLIFMLPVLSIGQQPTGIEAGANALGDLTQGLQDYINPVTTVIYIVAIILGLVGAFRVYVNWQQGKDNVMQTAAGWFGSCLFLLIANTVLRAMFI